MQNSSTDELFPLSWLSQYSYCPRRCGLIALEQIWEDNEETASGRIQHERVHTSRIECKGNDIYLYELNVFSRSLGVNGKCDCVEARASTSGVALPYGKGRYVLRPVEYKHGIVRDEEEYRIQCCAQAICLEEQFDCVVPAGSIFFINAHRRSEVEFTEQLRQKAMDTAENIREMLLYKKVPLGQYSTKCKKCSLLSICSPKLNHSAEKYCQSLWGLAVGKEDIP